MDSSSSSSAAAADEEAPATQLVCDGSALLSTLVRLHAHNDAIIFWNAEESFKILLRNDPVDLETYAFDLSILCEEDADDPLNKMLQTEHDGFFDEPGVFTFETTTVSQSSTADSDDVRTAMTRINDIWAYKICMCGSYLIKDDGSMCNFCAMTLTPADREVHFCPICHENSIRKHMTRQDCCSQYIHTSCLNTWYAKGDPSSAMCPLCRG
jgi:hypothetical protein